MKPKSFTDIITIFTMITAFILIISGLILAFYNSFVLKAPMSDATTIISYGWMFLSSGIVGKATKGFVTSFGSKHKPFKDNM